MSSAPIAFRLPPPYDGELEKQARAKQLTAGTHAKTIIMEALADTHRHRLEDDLQSLQLEVGELHRVLRNALLLLLAHAGQLSEDDANEWVRLYVDLPRAQRGPAGGKAQP